MSYAYLKAFHLVFLIVWLGGLMGLSRFLGYHVKEDEHVRARLSRIEKRIYYCVCLPGGIAAVTFGVLLLLGFGRDLSVGDALAMYMAPRSTQNTLWGATFHAKLTSVAALLACDFFTIAQINKLAKGGEMPGRLRYSILHGLEAALVIIIVILMIAQPMAKA